jgi:hypothetical protein
MPRFSTHPSLRRRSVWFAILSAAALSAGLAGQPAVSATHGTHHHEVRPFEPREQSPKELLARVAPRALQVPLVKGLPVTGATGVGTRIDGLTMRDQRTANNGNSFSLEPPDQALCVGNGYVVEGVNDVFSIYSRNGTKLSGNKSFAPFWNHGRAEIVRHPNGTVTYGPFMSDPKCYYDPGLHRFFMTMLQLSLDPHTGAFTDKRSVVDIAVSKTSVPSTHAKDWHLYRLNVRNDGTQGTPSHTGCPCFGDQPLIGADRNGFYITTNEFPLFQAGFNGAQLYAFDKAALTHGKMKVQRIENENLPLAEGVAYSVQPATSPNGSQWSSAANGTEYFLSALEFTGGLDNRVAAWAITNTASLKTANPNVHLSSTVLSSEVYGLPPSARQKNGPTPQADALNEPENRIETNDDRMNQVVYADGRLWSGLNTELKRFPNLATRTGIAYFVVSPHATASGVSATMDHDGYVAVNRNNVIFPAIGVTPQGEGVMVFTLTGVKYFPSAAQVHLRKSGAVEGGVQMVAVGAVPADGFTGYPDFGGDGVERWGDYSAAVMAPNGRVWTATEYIPGTFGYPHFIANWGTYLASVNP